MCDPITLGLMAAGTAFSAYGASRVAGAQKKDIARFEGEAKAERGRQQGYVAENEKTIGNTLDMYGKPAQDVASADAIASRQSAYTNPLQAKNFVSEMPADFDPNNVVAGRNRATGEAVKSKSIAEALAKGKLDAYGDVQTRTGIAANDNANKIDMVRRISRGSADAANQYQQVLPTAMKADENAGATWNSIGDILKMASMASGVSGGFGTGASWGNFAGSVPGVDTGTLAARVGSQNIAGTGVKGWLSDAFNYVSPFGKTTLAPSFAGPMQAPISTLVKSSFAPSYTFTGF